MPLSQTVTIELTPETAARLNAAVAEGLYPDLTQAVSAVVNVWDDQEQARTDLRGLLEAGMASGPGEPAEQVFKRLRQRYGK
ncbi:hypothetical protein GCM10011497_24490 [Elstera cyanobacteriorum]|uniref:CopG family transcriptional regulator n=1 Tax=Elstera cyanobacteriorum TaxID=2022747 RepID=A0A255XM96_9PROT|nr:hypothetical protein [Elstera cyanobacteriorum]OYQ17390.1 hypothetical protein CHR90_15650 [Elstera cyanobacteriorum]GFZ93493.1 hypothetical protein GCM10011497_24490 [Elstera cyanobacteriorum]